MKKIITHFFGVALALTAAFAPQNARGQCANNNVLWSNVGNINPGQTVTINGTWGGEYNTFNCVSGATYVITTCAGGSWDSQLTLYNNSGGPSLAYNDDFCGLQSQITWTATFSGTVRVLLDAYPCISNNTSMTMKITRNASGGGSCWDGTITGTGSVSSTTCGAGNESALRPSTDRIYRINIQTAGCYNFSTCGSSSWDSYLYLSTACPGTGNAGTIIASNDDACGVLSQISNVTLAPGIYYLTVEGFGSTNCGPFTLNVTSGAAPVAGSISSPTSIGCGSTATFSVPFQSGVNYNWSASNGTIVSGQGTNAVSIAWGSGTGTVSVIPSNSCGTGVAVSTTLNCTPPPVNDICANAIPFTGNSQSFTNNFATGTDISSCTFNDFNDVWYAWTAPACGQVTFSTVCGANWDTHLSLFSACGGAEIACNDDAFDYSCGTGLTSSISADVSAGQTYYVRVAGYNGASGSGTINMTMSTPVSVSIASSVPNSTLCFSNGNASTTLTATINGGSGTVNYQWQYQDNSGNWVNMTGSNTAGGGTSPMTVSQNASPTTTRNYRIAVTANGSCVETATQLVTVIPDPVLSLVSTDVTCFGANNGTAGGVLSGGTQANSYNFNWSPGSPVGDGTLNVTDLAPGTYTLSATGMYGCNADASITINEPELLVASAEVGQIACYGGTSDATISAVGGTLPYSGIGVESSLSAGTYTYTVIDANGCESDVTFELTEPDLLVASSTSTEILCYGGESIITVSAVGGTPAYSGTVNYTVNAGSYDYVVTDANGCTANTSITVTQPTQLFAYAGEDASVYYGYGPQACTDLTGSGIDGTPGYQYEWSVNGVTAGSGALINVCPGSSTDYTLTVTDANGCTATDDVSVCVTDVTCQAGNSPVTKVEMCMIPPGNPNNAHTICIDESAVPEHLLLGCQLGACDEFTTGCGASAQRSLNVEEEESIVALSVYPNPTKSATTVSVTVKNKGSYAIALYDLMGKQLMTVYKGTFEQFENLSFDMNMEMLQNGMYIIGVLNDGQMISNVKVIKE